MAHDTADLLRIKTQQVQFVLILERKLLLTFLPRFPICTRRTPQHHPIPPYSARSSELLPSRRMCFLQHALQRQNRLSGLSSGQLRHLVTSELIVAVIDLSYQERGVTSRTGVINTL